MAVYAIGDVQGCFDELLKLVDVIEFNPKKDQIWLAGDLVNRGPKSAEVLRWAKNLGPDNVKVVLGNHDLHLLATAAGVNQHQHRMDTMESILDAEDCDELIFWLRHQALFHHDEALAFSMVHAGVPPQWSIKKCLKRALEVEAILQSENWRDFFKHMYGNKPDTWSKKLTGWKRLRYITNCFTRLRYCYTDGRLALDFKGAPSKKPKGELPWFDMPERKTKDNKIIFGHWSTLGVGQYGNVFSTDSGAVWGEQLTAVRIDEKKPTWFVVEADPAGLPHAKNK
ncbi:MAG: symmetrical bis(5'-nucleosyl)-tetraphosphatase [Gammaproteobacteria bacterium]|nr:symmetrical bis(5'-nucleosyl)-tetraphosphatase [Gammaproteobacteria bacterium]